MPKERLIRRYTPYFEGWAQAFGNHRGGYTDDERLNWLFSEDEDQIGLILTPKVKRLLFREVLARHGTHATLILNEDRIGVGRMSMPTEHRDREAVRTLNWLFDAPGDLHLYPTYHLFYSAGIRILTLSRKAPLLIIYKEVEPLTVRIG